VTAKNGHNPAGFRKLQKFGFSYHFILLFVTVSFYITKNRHIMTVTNVTICDHFGKSGHIEDGYRKFQKSFCIWLFFYG
jgi:hypothetical protein